MYRLKHALFAIVALAMICAVTAPADAGGSPTFSPPIQRIELGAPEPVAPGSDAQVFSWAGWGGNPDDQPGRNIYWALLPDEPSFPGLTYFKACGFPPREPPQSDLTTPGGSHQTLKVKVLAETDCYLIALDWRYGMERGRYTLTLNHRLGTLTHRWRVDYATRPTGVVLIDQEPSTSRFVMLMGFAPNERLDLRFYGPIVGALAGGEYIGFIASRRAQADSEGALMLEIRASRSAGYDAGSVETLIGGYNRDAPNGATIYNVYMRQTQCPGALPTRFIPGQWGVVLPGQPNRIRSSPGGEIVGMIEPELSFKVLEGPRCQGGYAWLRIKDGILTGWTAESGDGTYWLVPNLSGGP